MVLGLSWFYNYIIFMYYIRDKMFRKKKEKKTERLGDNIVCSIRGIERSIRNLKLDRLINDDDSLSKGVELKEKELEGFIDGASCVWNVLKKYENYANYNGVTANDVIDINNHWYHVVGTVIDIIKRDLTISKTMIRNIKERGKNDFFMSIDNCRYAIVKLIDEGINVGCLCNLTERPLYSVDTKKHKDVIIKEFLLSIGNVNVAIGRLKQQIDYIKQRKQDEINEKSWIKRCLG